MSVSPWVRLVCMLLAGTLVISVVPDQACAQTLDNTSSSSSSDSTEDEVLIGFAVVVVALLLILGIRSDLEKYKSSRVQITLDEYAQADDMPVEVFDDMSKPELGW